MDDAGADGDGQAVDARLASADDAVAGGFGEGFGEAGLLDIDGFHLVAIVLAEHLVAVHDHEVLARTDGALVLGVPGTIARAVDGNLAILQVFWSKGLACHLAGIAKDVGVELAIDIGADELCRYRLRPTP